MPHHNPKGEAMTSMQTEPVQIRAHAQVVKRFAG